MVAITQLARLASDHSFERDWRYGIAFPFGAAMMVGLLVHCGLRTHRRSAVGKGRRGGPAGPRR